MKLNQLSLAQKLAATIIMLAATANLQSAAWADSEMSTYDGGSGGQGENDSGDNNSDGEGGVSVNGDNDCGENLAASRC